MRNSTINKDLSRFVENLSSGGASDSEIVHAQNIAAAVMLARSSATLSCEVEKTSIQLSFALGFPDSTQMLVIDPIIAEVSKPINCVSSSSIRFLTNEVAALISVVLRRGEVIRDRDPFSATVFRNEINGIMSDAGLEGKQLVAAQTVQKFMINVHEMQPLAKFAVTIDPLVVIVSEIDVVSLFLLNELKKTNAHIASISAACSRTTVTTPPKYELHFAIDTDEKNHKGELPSRKRSASGFFSFFSSSLKN